MNTLGNPIRNNRYFAIPLTTVAAAGIAIVTPTSVQVQQGYDFLLKSIRTQSTGIYDVIFGFPGVDFMSDYVRNTNIFGTALFPSPFEPSILVPDNFSLTFKFRNQIAGANTIILALVGELVDKR